MQLSLFVRFIFISTILLAIVSCSRRPSYVLNEKQMVLIFKDMYIADGVISNNRTDYKSYDEKDALINGVLSKYGVTQAQFDSSLVWYSDNIEIYSQVQDSINSQLQRFNDSITRENIDQYKFNLTGFKASLPEHYRLEYSNPTFRFRIDSSEMKLFDKENFRFSFLTQGIDTALHNIDATVYYKYKDTTVVSRTLLLSDGYYEFLKPNLSDSLLYEIFAYIHMKEAKIKIGNVNIRNIKNTETSIRIRLVDTLDTSIEKNKSVEHDAVMISDENLQAVPNK